LIAGSSAIDKEQVHEYGGRDTQGRKDASVKKRSKILKIGVIALVATALPIARAGIASADYAATPYDFVGIGGDTPQFSLDYLANGDADGDPGFNATSNKRRLVTFDAESDANGRAAYYGSDEGTNSGTAEDPTDVLRDGEFPGQRNSSSGNAINTLEADTPGDINFIFSSTGLSGSSYAVPLHEYEFGTDTVALAADSTTNAPSGLTDAQLAGIYEGTAGYTTWNGSGIGGSSSATIVPLLPPLTSAITKTFLGAIGVSSANLGASVKFVEQNDPTAITLNSSPANAIVPFSQARYLLLEGSANYNGGFLNSQGQSGATQNSNGYATAGPSAPYFPAIPGEPGFLSGDAGEAYPLQPQYAPPIALLTSSATTTVTDYIDIRQSDLGDSGASSDIEPGSTVNWADYLFAGTTGVTPYIDTVAAQTLIFDSGVTPNYVDKGEFA
jgi:hypothetical protein